MKRIAILTALAGIAFGQTPSIDQALSMKAASGPQISPDGRFVAYMQQETSWDDNEFVQQIWIAAAGGGSRFQLTHARKSSERPRWSPDSKLLAFLSDRDGKRQIYLISPAGGEAVKFTDGEADVESFEWSPDGASIAFTSTGPEPKAKKDRKDKYGEFEIFNEDYPLLQLWAAPVTSEVQRPKPDLLTPGSKFTVESFSWSPDSRSLAFEAQQAPGYGYADTAAVYVVDLGAKQPRKLPNQGIPQHHPVWSPDGRRIALMTFDPGKDSFWANIRIAVTSPAGGVPRILTGDFDENARLTAWGRNGIYFSALHRTESSVYRVDPETGRVTRIGPVGLSVQTATFTSDDRAMAAMGTGPNRFPEVIVSPVNDFQPKYLTDMNGQWQSFSLATREAIQWKSTDGTPVEGILIKPAGYEPGRKYPLLVVIHGGPAYLDTPARSVDRDYPVELFAAKGALILKPNYRGSTGYGEKFRSLNVRNLGLGDYQDVISGVDSLIAAGLVDKDRVGSMGWSQGGFISAFITTYSDRFKAVSVGAGVVDWSTYYVNTDIPFFTRQYLKATPWEDPEIYRKTSPISYISTAKTPTLIQHGSLDKRVPPPNAFELYRALKDKGVPVKLILYTGFGHTIEKPKQQRALMQHNYEWFSQYIWGEEAAH